MADKFVWSGAVGANDGSTWEDAYTSGMRDWGVEAGFTPGTDFVYFRDSHSESSATSITITGSNAESTIRAVDVLSVVGADTGTAPGALSRGAAVNTSDTSANIEIFKSIYINGVDFLSNNDIQVANPLAGIPQNVVLEDCRLELIGVSSDRIALGNAGGNEVIVRMINVDMDFAVSSQVVVGNSGMITWDGGSVLFDINLLMSSPFASAGEIIFRGVDFTAMVGGSLLRLGFGSHHREITFSRCKLDSGTGITDGGTIDVPGIRVEAYNCQFGTDSDPAFQYEKLDARGVVQSDVIRFRTDGASDGERTNPFSWSIDTTVGSVRGYPGHALESGPIASWTDGDAATAHTYRIYIASGGTLNDDDIWFELEGPNDVATDSLSVFNTTRVAPRTTAAAITTDAVSTWNGTDVGTLQQMDITYTPDKPGPVTARVFLAKATDRVSVDPKIYIDP